jgi:hypothetical protein
VAAAVTAPDPFPVLDVTGWPALAEEPMGTKEKEWVQGEDGALWLFKRVREVDDPRVGHRVFGEDWSEKLAAEIAASIAVPTARVELATRHGHRGVVSRTVRAGAHEDLVHGNELLQRVDPAYEAGRQREVPGYTVAAVFGVLAGSLPPPALQATLDHAGEAFAGYLLFDAMVANTDRHHENWGIIQPPVGPAWLAPSFDHATSLNFQEPQEIKRLRLEGRESGRTVEAWASRGRSSHFAGRPFLVDLAAEALERAGRRASEHWRTQLERADDERWSRAAAKVPDALMSQVDRRFVLEMLRINRRRLLDACWRR